MIPLALLKKSVLSSFWISKRERKLENIKEESREKSGNSEVVAILCSLRAPRVTSWTSILPIKKWHVVPPIKSFQANSCNYIFVEKKQKVTTIKYTRYIDFNSLWYSAPCVKVYRLMYTHLCFCHLYKRITTFTTSF